jgi:hypothetical protein
MRRSNGRLDVYVDGKLKAKCNINIPRGVRAYVGLDGRAKQVTIVPERGTYLCTSEFYMLQVSFMLFFVSTELVFAQNQS